MWKEVQLVCCRLICNDIMICHTEDWSFVTRVDSRDHSPGMWENFELKIENFLALGYTLCNEMIQDMEKSSTEPFYLDTALLGIQVSQWVIQLTSRKPCLELLCLLLELAIIFIVFIGFCHLAVKESLFNGVFDTWEARVRLNLIDRFVLFIIEVISLTSSENSEESDSGWDVWPLGLLSWFLGCGSGISCRLFCWPLVESSASGLR